MTAGADGGEPPRSLTVSIVIPVLNEEQRIGACLSRLCADFPESEIVVVDGGSTDRTVELAEAQVLVVGSPAGRATQMNAGARKTSGDVLWFVHADCLVPKESVELIRQALVDPVVVGGGLTLSFDQRSIGLDWLAYSSNVRAKRLGWIFGDQAMFVRREVFDAVGGFPDLPLMEDLELSRRLRRRGRMTVLDATTTASARRLVEHGPWRMNVLMQVLKLQHFLGVDAERIKRRYEAGPRRGGHLRSTRS